MTVRPDANQPTSIAVEGTIIRANGDVEELGTLAYAHRNPIKHLLGQRRVRGGSILKSIVGRGPKVQDH